MKIPIVFATDKNYIFYTCITITSLAKNAGPDTEYEIYILVSEEFPKESLFDRAGKKYDNLSIKIIRVRDEVFRNVIIHNGYITKATFYRLILDSLIDVDKCIYLDSDIIVTEDLTSLFLTDMEENYIAGCRDIWMDIISEEDVEKWRKRINLPSMDEYINAGVLVMNLRKIREDGLEQKFVQHMNYDYLHEDQDIINAVCYGRIKRLPSKWNIFTKFLGSLGELRKKGISEETLCDFSKRKGILHYATPFIRPWEHTRYWANDEWWRMALEWKDEPVYQELEERLRRSEETEQWEYYIRKGNKYSRIVIFGFTIYGKQICDWLLNSGFKDKLEFCDNNPDKRNLNYKGIKVHLLEEIDRGNTWFINTSQRRGEEVENLLLAAGIDREDITRYSQRSWEYYYYMDRAYYLQELKDIFCRECGRERKGFVDNLAEMRDKLAEEPMYQEWHHKYDMRNWILKMEEEYA